MTLASDTPFPSNRHSNGDSNYPAVDRSRLYPEPDDFDVNQMVAIARRRKWLIAGVALATTTSIWGWTLTRTPIYRGDFQVLVEPITEVDPSQELLQDNQIQLRTNFDYSTQIEVLRSPALLRPIVETLQETYPEITYQTLAQNLTISRLRDTKVLSVSYRDENPERIKAVLQVVSDHYLQYSFEQRQTSLQQGVQFVEEQLPDLRERVNMLQVRLERFRQQYSIIDPETRGAELSTLITSIEEQQQNTQTQLTEAQSLYASLRDQLGYDSSEALAASSLSESPRYQSLLNEIQEVETQIAAESARFQPDMPNVQILEDRRDSLIPLLQQEAERILNGQSGAGANGNLTPISLDLSRQLVNTANQVQVLQTRGQALAQVEQELKQEFSIVPALAREYTELQRELAIATDSLNRFLSTRETLQIDAAQKSIPWELISEPAASHAPIAPNVPRSMILGAIAGLLLGAGSALLVDKLDNVLHTPEDAKEFTRLPNLGIIPHIRDLTPAPSANATVASSPTEASYQSSPFLEAFRSLYTNLRFLGVDQKIRSLVVSSAAPSEGKSTVAINLARAAAVMGQRVLLVDADLRLPQVHHRLQMPNLQGLSDALTSDQPLSAVARQSTIDSNLFIVTAGTIPPDPIKLLSSKRMRQLVEEAQREFDLTIYDVPPLLGFADSNLLAAETDGMLLVIGLGKTDRGELKQVIEMLKVSPISILGTVANGIRHYTTRRYGYHRYHHYYNRQAETTATQPFLSSVRSWASARLSVPPPSPSAESGDAPSFLRETAIAPEATPDAGDTSVTIGDEVLDERLDALDLSDRPLGEREFPPSDDLAPDFNSPDFDADFYARGLTASSDDFDEDLDEDGEFEFDAIEFEDRVSSTDDFDDTDIEVTTFNTDLQDMLPDLPTDEASFVQPDALVEESEEILAEEAGAIAPVADDSDLPFPTDEAEGVSLPSDADAQFVAIADTDEPQTVVDLAAASVEIPPLEIPALPDHLLPNQVSLDADTTYQPDLPPASEPSDHMTPGETAPPVDADPSLEQNTSWYRFLSGFSPANWLRPHAPQQSSSPLEGDRSALAEEESTLPVEHELPEDSESEVQSEDTDHSGLEVGRSPLETTTFVEDSVGEVEESATSSEEFITPSEEFTTSVEEFVTPLEESVSAVDEFTTSVEEFITPSEEFTTSVEAFVTPLEESVSAVEESTPSDASVLEPTVTSEVDVDDIPEAQRQQERQQDKSRLLFYPFRTFHPHLSEHISAFPSNSEVILPTAESDESHLNIEDIPEAVRISDEETPSVSGESPDTMLDPDMPQSAEADWSSTPTNRLNGDRSAHNGATPPDLATIRRAIELPDETSHDSASNLADQVLPAAEVALPPGEVPVPELDLSLDEQCGEDDNAESEALLAASSHLVEAEGEIDPGITQLTDTYPPLTESEPELPTLTESEPELPTTDAQSTVESDPPIQELDASESASSVWLLEEEELENIQEFYQDEAVSGGDRLYMPIADQPMEDSLGLPEASEVTPDSHGQNMEIQSDNLDESPTPDASLVTEDVFVESQAEVRLNTAAESVDAEQMATITGMAAFDVEANGVAIETPELEKLALTFSEETYQDETSDPASPDLDIFSQDDDSSVPSEPLESSDAVLSDSQGSPGEASETTIYSVADDHHPSPLESSQRLSDTDVEQPSHAVNDHPNPHNYFTQAILLAREAMLAGQSAQQDEDWQKISSHWQQAARLMSQLSPVDENYAIAQRCQVLYLKNSEYARLKSEETLN